MGRARITAAALLVAVALAGCGLSAAGEGRPTKPVGGGASGGNPSPRTHTETPATTPRTPAKPPTKPPPKPPPFRAEIERVDRDRVPHSWRPGCPVPLSQLRLLRMTYWGFDREAHTGQMIVNAEVARDVVRVFRTLYRKRFPIRRMRLVDEYGGSDFRSVDDDNTSAFNCRTVAGTDSMSMHAYGLAIDVNPCENPYVEADGSIAHPQCQRYVDRGRRAKGMVHDGAVVVRAFARIGWEWGGHWSGTVDYQHFSTNGH